MIRPLVRRRPVDSLVGELDGGGVDSHCRGHAGNVSLRSGRAATGRRAIDVLAPAATGGNFTAGRAGTSVVTQSSSVATSVAMPGDAGNAVGSSAGTRSMTVRRVSTVVPCRA